MERSLAAVASVDDWLDRSGLMESTRGSGSAADMMGSSAPTGTTG
jgi:hypothetical protein